ncbi:MAG: glycosyl hydrolase [Woeseiaceae bacterium]
MKNSSRLSRAAAEMTSVAMLLVLFGCNASSSQPEAATTDAGATEDDARLLIIGQDLDAIRGYMASGCCADPDALTAYLDFYDLLKADDFGGLGIDADGNELDFELSWGAGPVSAYATAKEFGVDSVAIGLSIKENDHPGALDQLVAGDHDDKILQLARYGSMVDGTIYLRIGYEFDGAWNYGYENRERFIKAYRRIVDVLAEAGADNFEYVWQASAAGVDEIIDRGHEDVSEWYPGDDYVDWMAISWFMNPDERSVVDIDNFEPMTPGELSEEVIEFARSKGKPVMIAEASPQAFDLNENWTAHHSAIWDGESGSSKQDKSSEEIWEYWYAPLFALMYENRDVIKALAYINVDWDSQQMWGPPYPEGFWGDSRLETNAEIAHKFNAAIAAWKSVE